LRGIASSIGSSSSTWRPVRSAGARRTPRFAKAIGELIVAATGIEPPGYGLERDSVIRG
jgi:hypothetical protein